MVLSDKREWYIIKYLGSSWGKLKQSIVKASYRIHGWRQIRERERFIGRNWWESDALLWYMHYASKGKRREGHVVDVEQRAYHISHFSSASISDSERERERASGRWWSFAHARLGLRRRGYQFSFSFKCNIFIFTFFFWTANF